MEASPLERFQAWLHTARPGQSYTYVSGVTWLDERQKNNSKLRLVDEPTRAAADAA